MSYDSTHKAEEASKTFLEQYLNERGELPAPKYTGRYLWRNIEEIRIDEQSELERIADMRFVG